MSSKPQRSPSQSTSFLGDPQRWTPPRPTVFTGGFSWINKDASNVKSKSHIAKVRAHVRNEYRYWKPGDPPKSKPPNEIQHSGDPPSPAKSVTVGSSPSVASSEISSSSKEVHVGDSPSVANTQSPGTVVSTTSDSAEQEALAVIPRQQPTAVRRKFFDPVRGLDSVLETYPEENDQHERANQQCSACAIPSRLADPAKLISDAKGKAVNKQSAPPARSKHESSKLLREVREFHLKQTALQNQSLKTSIGGLRDDPFVSFPIESRRSVIEAADYWVNFWVPAQTPGYIKAGSWKPVSDRVFSITTGDEGAFQSQVALALSYLSRNSDKGEEPTKEVLYHQARAMKSLRKHLEAGSISAGPLLSSLNLLIMSVVHADRNSYDFHRKGLERMIQTPPANSTTGLLHAVINGYFVTSRFYFRLLKLQTRIRTRTPLPILLNDGSFTPVAYPTHPFPPHLASTISTLPPGFQELALELTLPLPLISSLAQISRWNVVIAPGGSEQGVAIWFSWDDAEANLSVLERLSSSSSVDPNSKNPELPLAYPLSLTLLLYSITAHNRFHATRIYVQLVRDAIASIRQFHPRTTAQKDCKVWMAIIAAGCARDAGPGNGRIESGGLLGNVARELGLEGSSRTITGRQKQYQQQQEDKPMSWTSAATIMKRFFWYDGFEKNWKTCWEVEVMGRGMR